MSKSRCIAGLTATALSIPLLFPAAAGANATFGQSDEPVKAPMPGACHGYLWTNTMGERLSIENPRIVIPGLVKPAGVIDVTEVVNFDARKRVLEDHDEEYEEEFDQSLQLLEVENENENEIEIEKPAPKPVIEKYEKMRVEFWKGKTMLGATSYSPDLLDDAPFSWVRTPLGRVDIFEEADRVEIVHASQFMKTDGDMDAFFPMSVCITWREHVTDNAVAADISCAKANLTISNDGTAKGYVRVIANGTSTDYKIAPYGGSQTHQVALGEDQWADVKVVDLADGTVLFEKKWLTDCVAPATTTTNRPVVNAVVTAPATPEVEPQVLGTQVTAPAQAQLARTGSQTATNAGIGATLLAFGLGLVTFGRRRKAQA
jgi:hypothetical protein